MKRTTYIIVGLLLTGLIVMSASMIYFISHAKTWDDATLQVGGDDTMIDLPKCKVVKFSLAKRDTNFWINFLNSELNVKQAEGDTTRLAYTTELERYFVTKQVGDTLEIVFDFFGKKPGKDSNGDIMRIELKPLTLFISSEVVVLENRINNLDTHFCGIRRDSLSFIVRDKATLDNCLFTTLYASGNELDFKSGKVQDLYLNLDKIDRWNVETDSFKIDTEYLSAKGYCRSTLKKGECRQVVWIPKDDAKLELVLKESMRLVVEE